MRYELGVNGESVHEEAAADNSALEGACIMGLTLAMHGEITFKDGLGATPSCQSSRDQKGSRR
jgi:hypothetical protein